MQLQTTVSQTYLRFPRHTEKPRACRTDARRKHPSQ